MGNGPGNLMIYEGKVFMYNVEFNGNMSPFIASMFILLNSPEL